MGRLRMRKRRGSMLTITVVVFAVFVLAAFAVTLAASSYYNGAIARHSREQAYLSARSVIEAMAGDPDKLAEYINNQALDTPEAIELGAGDSEEMGIVSLKLHQESAAEYLLTATGTYKGEQAAASVRLAKRSSGRSEEPALYFDSTTYETTECGGIRGTADAPVTCYLRTRKSYLQYTAKPNQLYRGAAKVVNWDSASAQKLTGSLVVEFRLGDSLLSNKHNLLYQDSLSLENLTIDGDVYIIANTVPDPADGSEHGVDIVVSGCTITGRIYVIGNFHSLTVADGGIGRTSSVNTQVIIDRQPSDPAAAGAYSISALGEVPGSAGITALQKADYADISGSAPAASGYTITGASGTIKLSAYNGAGQTLVFDASDGGIHRYVVNCAGVKEVLSSWKIKGSGKVVLYLTNVNGSFGATFNVGSGRTIGANAASDSRTDAPQLYIFAAGSVYFNVSGTGFVNAALYGTDMSLSLLNAGDTGKILFAGTFWGKSLSIGSSVLDAACFFNYLPFDGSGARTVTYEVISYE